eukprot:7634984-Lingulodinium_polyedra.AAC.1
MSAKKSQYKSCNDHCHRRKTNTSHQHGTQEEHTLHKIMQKSGMAPACRALSKVSKRHGH